MFSMNALRRRTATGVAVTALTLGVALGLMGGAPSQANATANDSGGTATVCKFDGKDYSPGAAVYTTDPQGNMHKFVCQSDGTWNQVFIVVSPTPTRLPLWQYAAPSGGTLMTR